jgi:hypothetical protein
LFPQTNEECREAASAFACEQLKILFPQTNEECREAASAFASISRGEAIVHYVGAIDGYLLHTEAPPKSVFGNVPIFQVTISDMELTSRPVVTICQGLFCLYIAVAGPRVMNDNQAINEVDIAELISNLPFGFCVIVSSLAPSTALYAGLPTRLSQLGKL